MTRVVHTDRSQPAISTHLVGKTLHGCLNHLAKLWVLPQQPRSASVVSAFAFPDSISPQPATTPTDLLADDSFADVLFVQTTPPLSAAALQRKQPAPHSTPSVSDQDDPYTPSREGSERRSVRLQLAVQTPVFKPPFSNPRFQKPISWRRFPRPEGQHHSPFRHAPFPGTALFSRALSTQATQQLLMPSTSDCSPEPSGLDARPPSSRL
eukprot:1840734-Rhodomonas_salina.3